MEIESFTISVNPKAEQQQSFGANSKQENGVTPPNLREDNQDVFQKNQSKISKKVVYNPEDIF